MESQIKTEASLPDKETVRSVGRPKAITREVVQELMGFFKQGMDIKSACTLSGISTSTYYAELARNQRFTDKMTIAQRQTTLYANILVAKAVERGDLRTAKWWLEREDRLEHRAQQAAEYRHLKRLVITEMQQSSHSVSVEVER